MIINNNIISNKLVFKINNRKYLSETTNGKKVKPFRISQKKIKISGINLLKRI